LVSLLALAAVLLAVAAVWGWKLAGGRLVVMETPSMCPTVCVGSLVADRPLHGPVHVGEMITFHPPTNRSETYTHRISRIFANGMIQTKGIANPSPDPWLITRSDVVGQVSFTVWGLGWVLKALPLLAVGVLSWVVIRPWIAQASRRSWDRMWMVALTVVPLWVLRPLVRGGIISTGSDKAHPHWLTASVRNTGLLSAAFRTTGGPDAASVKSAGLGQVSGPAGRGGYLMVHQALSLTWWGWAVMAAIVASPLLGFLWHVWRDNETYCDPDQAGPGPVVEAGAALVAS
jgi:signal peptidase I